MAPFSRFLRVKMVELRGLEPLAYTLRTYRSSQLSYSPIPQKILMAEGVGFEPTGAVAPAVFKTAALNHSTIPPGQVC